MPDSQPQPPQPQLDLFDESPLSRRTSLTVEADVVLAETEAELAQRELQLLQATASGQPVVLHHQLNKEPADRATLSRPLSPLGKQWADSMAADMARRTSAPAADSTSLSVPQSLAHESMFEGADGPEADEAWRSLVAQHPDATVIDDFLIALPSEGEESQREPEPEMVATAGEQETVPQVQSIAAAEPDSAQARPPQLDPRNSKHGLLRRLGLTLVWIAALLWVWQIVRTKRLRR